MRVTLEELCKYFGPVKAVDGLSLDIQDKEFVALLGPSGCGKTTTLLTIAGFYKPTSGAVLFDGKRVDHLAPRERNIGMVFQSYALYPHMSAFDNIAFPLKLKGVARRLRERKVKEVAALLRIGEILSRKPSELSGGQQQRVALARALVKEPGLLLLDEPLSNLDAKLRITMRAELKRLQKDLGITTIFVTHDQVEAMTMADRIALLNEGRLQQVGTPVELYRYPANTFVAGFIGTPPMNFLPGRLVSAEDKLTVVTEHFTLPIPARRLRQPFPGEKEIEVIFGIRPEDIVLGQGAIQGEVYVVEPMGKDALITLRLGEETLKALVSLDLHLHVGEKVNLNFPPDKVHLFEPGTGASLLGGRRES